MATYYFSGTEAQNFAATQDFAKALKRTTETAGSQVVTVANSTTEPSFAITDALVPSNADWETGTVTVKVRVTTANSNIRLAVQAVRMNSAGVAQENTGTTAEQTLSATGVYTFSLPSQNWTAGNCSDRFLIWYYFRSTQSHGGAASVTIETGTADTSVVAAGLTEFAGTCYSAFTRDFEQFESDHNTKIATGATLDNGDATAKNIYLDGYVKAALTDHTLTAKVEVEAVGTAFDNTATHTSSVVLQANPNRPHIRRSAVVAYDSKRKRLLLCGGLDDQAVQYNDLWEFSLNPVAGAPKGQWKKLAPTGTPMSARRTHVMQYDERNDRLIVGYGYDGADKSDIFAISFSGSADGAWSTLSTTGTPPEARAQPSSAIDNVNGYFFLVHGWGAARYNDVHRLNLTTLAWTELNAGGGTAPSTRNDPAVVFDEANNRLVIFGGYDGTNRLNDVWELDLGTNAYTQLTGITGTAASTRELAQAVYDQGGPQYFFNGSGGTITDSNSVWTSDSNLEDGSIATSAYTSDGVYGSVSSNFLHTKGTSAPATGATITAVKARVHAGAGLGYGGRGAWVTLTTPSGGWTWAKVQALETKVYTTAPSGDQMNAAIYTSGLAELLGTATRAIGSGVHEVYQVEVLVQTRTPRMVITGGRGGTAASDIRKDILAINLTDGSESWTDLTPADGSNPPFVWSNGHGIYDPWHQLFIVTMGTDESLYESRFMVAWDMSTGSTTQGYSMFENHGLRGRDAMGYAYNPDLRHTMIVGGLTDPAAGTTSVSLWDGQHSGEIWIYDHVNQDWLQPLRHSIVSIPSREGCATVYDTNRNRFIIFGGLSGNNTSNNVHYNDVWEVKADADNIYRLAKLNPTGTKPSKRWLPGYCYDSTNDRMIIFGGDASGTYQNDTWELDFSGSADGAWAQLSPTGTPPSARRQPHAIYDPTNNRMLLTHGATGVNTFVGDTFSLSLSTNNGAWTTITPATRPSNRRGAVIAYASDKGYAFFTGGYDGTNVLNDTWYFNLSTNLWTQLSPAAQYGVRRSHAGGYDATSERMVIFGGRDAADAGDSFITRASTWEFDSVNATEANWNWSNINAEVYLQASVPVKNLTAATNYHWQFWASTADGDSAKSSYGGNAESAVDFKTYVAGLAALVAQAASFTLTGIATNLLRQLRVTGTVATYTVTGIAATLTKTVTLTASQQTYTLTGFVTDFHRLYQTTFDTGGFTLSGTTTNLIRSYTLTANTGSFSLTGQNVVLTEVNSYSLTADTQSYSLTGNATNFQRGLNVSGTTQTYVVTGNAANLSYNRILSGTTQTYTLTGNVATLIKSVSLTANAGTFALTGNTANITVSRLLTGTTQTYTVSTFPSNLDRAEVMLASLGTFALTGNTANFVRTYVLPATVGTFTLTGTATGVTANRTISGATQTYALTGNAAGLIKTLTLPGVTQSYVVTGTTTNLSRQLTLSTTVGVFNLTGVDASFAREEILAADTQQFLLTGSDAVLTKSIVLPASTGSFVVTNNTAGLYANFLLSNTVGVFTFTGNSATLTELGLFTVDTVNFTLTGSTTNLLRQLVMTATTGAFTLTGITAGFQTAEVMSAASASFALTGNDVNFLLSKTLLTSTGVFNVTGVSNNFLRSVIHTTETGVFTLTTFPASLQTADVFGVTPGIFTLTGNQATFTRSEIVAVENGTFNLVGTTTGLLRQLVMSASVRTFTLTGIAAGFQTAEVVQGAVGTFTLTGNTTNFLRQLVMPAAVGTFAVTGIDTTFDRAEITQVDNGVFVLTGNAANFTISRSLTTTTGTFNVTGNTAGTYKTFALQAAVGTFALTGNAAAFNRAEIMVAEQGAFNLTMVPASLQTADVMGTTPGVFTVTGNTTAITRAAILTGTTQTYVVSGNTATLRRDYTLVASAGSFSLTGNPATLTKQFYLLGTTQTYNLIGFPASFGLAEILVVSHGIFNLAGTVTGFSRSLHLTADTGVFTETGNQAAILKNFLLTGTTQTYTVTGNSNTLVRNYSTVAGVGAFNLTGNNAGLLTVGTLQGDTGSFAVTGTSTTFIRTLIMVADTVAYTFTGVAANLNINEGLPVTNGAFTLTGNTANLQYSADQCYVDQEDGFTILLEDGSGGILMETCPVINLADNGVFVLTGNDAVIYKSSTAAFETGTFILTGNTAQLVKNYYLAAETGGFNITGTTTNLLFQDVEGVTNGSFILSGNEIAVSRTRVLQTQVGVFTISGIDAGIITEGSLFAQKGTFVFTGNNVTFQVNEIEPVNTGTFNVTGVNTGLRTARILTAETATFNTTGNSAAINLALTLVAEVGSFALNGANVNLPRALSISVSQGTFIVTGTDSSIDRLYVLPATTGTFAITGVNNNYIRTYWVTGVNGEFVLTLQNATLEGHFKVRYTTPSNRPRGGASGFQPRGLGTKQTQMGRGGSATRQNMRGGV